MWASLHTFESQREGAAICLIKLHALTLIRILPSGLEIEGDKSVKCYVEGSVSTACKPDGEKTKKENKGGSGGNDKLSKHSLKEFLQRGRKPWFQIGRV